MSERGGSLGGRVPLAVFRRAAASCRATTCRTTTCRRDEPERYLCFNGIPIPGASLPEEDRGVFRLNAIHRLGHTWYARANLGWVSDTHYFEDFSNSLYGCRRLYVRSTVGLYGRGPLGTPASWPTTIQLADYTLTERNLPLDRLPRAYLHWARPFGDWFEAGVDTEAVRFEHETSRRAGPDLKFREAPVSISSRTSVSDASSSWFVRPKLAWRYTGYQLDDTLAEARAAGHVSRHEVHVLRTGESLPRR